MRVPWWSNDKHALENWPAAFFNFLLSHSVTVRGEKCVLLNELHWSDSVKAGNRRPTAACAYFVWHVCSPAWVGSGLRWRASGRRSLQSPPVCSAQVCLVFAPLGSEFQSGLSSAGAFGTLTSFLPPYHLVFFVCSHQQASLC